MNSILVIIPVYNEQDTLASILSSLVSMEDIDVVVVDDSSQDDSLKVARSFSKISVIPLYVNLGAWGAIQAGLRYARKKNYQYAISMDGDGQHHVAELEKLLQCHADNSNVNVVIGACTQRGSRLRHWAWAFFRRITGVGIEDLTSGFRLYNREAIELLSGKEGTLVDYQDVGVLLLLQQAGLKVMETPVLMSPRKSGKSHIYYSWFAVAYYMLFTTVLSLAKGKPFRIERSDTNSL